MPDEHGGDKWNKWEIVAVAGVVLTTGLVVGLYRSGPFHSVNHPSLTAAVPTTTVATPPPTTNPANPGTSTPTTTGELVMNPINPAPTE